MTFLILKTVTPDGICSLSSLMNVENEHFLILGRPYPGDFPADATFKMDDNYPKNIRLADCLDNLSSLLVVSEKFRAALESVPGALVENAVLPVKLLNHKGRTEKAPYFIVQQLHHPSCIDETKSKGRKGKVNPDRFVKLEKMVLDEKGIPADRMLFRPAQCHQYLLVRSDLAASLRKAGLSGIELHDIEDYEF
jgi:hypothetical protein